MKKRLIPILLALLLLTLPVLAAEGSRVIDGADLFTPAQEAQLESQIQAFQKQTGLDFVILTNRTPHSSSAEAFADAYYENHGFGLDSRQSGVLFLIDFSDPDDPMFHVTTSGKAIDYLEDTRRNSYLNILGNALGQAKRSTGDYSRAASLAIEGFTEYYKAGIPEGQYQYNTTTGERTSGHKVITQKEGLISAAIAAVIGLIFYASTNSTYSLKGETYSYDFRANSAKQLTASKDQFLRTEHHRTVKPRVESNGPRGGGFSGGGGHVTTVHTSSGGHVHGGGGGHF